MVKPHIIHSTEEKFKKCTVSLEEEHIKYLDELAGEYSRNLGQRWSRSAVVRLAVGDFLSRIGKIA